MTATFYYDTILIQQRCVELCKGVFMEEKERYEIVYFDNDTSWKIIDNNTKQEVGGIDDMIKSLNQQDKRIKELEQKNLSLQEQSIRDNQNWIEETTELKQQLSDTEESYNNTMKYLNKIRSELLNLPKKIVGDIKEWIKSQIIYCGGKASDVDILIANSSNQVLEDLQNILDTILKKYGGEKNEK